MKKLYTFSTMLFVAMLFLANVGTVQAAPPAPFIVICHHTPANDVTLSFQNQQSYDGHLGTPHSGSTYDTIGACSVAPTATLVPTLTPTNTPTTDPGVTPTNTPTPDPGCTENCNEVTPTATAEVPVVKEGGRSCSAYAAYLKEVGHYERIEAVKRCLPANGVGELLANFLVWYYDHK